MEWLSAGDQHGDAGGHGKNVGEHRCRVDHVLEVVDHEQQLVTMADGRYPIEQRSTGVVGAKGVRHAGKNEGRRSEPGQIEEAHGPSEVPLQVFTELESQSRLPAAARAGDGHHAAVGADEELRQRPDLDVATDEAGRGRRQRRPLLLLVSSVGVGTRLRSGSVRADGRFGRRLEPLAQHDGQVGLHQVAELVGGGEVPIGGAVLVADPVDQVAQARLAIWCRLLDVDELRVSGGQQRLVLQAGDVHVRSDPAVALPVQPDEDVALLQVGAVQLPGGMRPRPQLEEHRNEAELLDRFLCGRSFRSHLLQRAAHEDPQALVRCSDHGRQLSHCVDDISSVAVVARRRTCIGPIGRGGDRRSGLSRADRHRVRLGQTGRVPEVSLRGIEVYYEHGGEGPRLLFLNGSGASLATTGPLIDRLRGPFELLAFDQRGLGRTSVPDTAPSMADYAADGLALADHVGWDRFRVVGISFGGMVAQELAVTAPERVERLALLCTSPGGPGLASYPLQDLVGTEVDPTIMDDRFTPAWLADHPIDAVIAEAFTGAFSAPTPGFLAQLDARRRHDVLDRLSRVTCPTYVAAGRHDGIAPLANSEAIVRAVPTAELHVYDGGHLFIIQDPSAFPDIKDFLSG